LLVVKSQTFDGNQPPKKASTEVPRWPNLCSKKERTGRGETNREANENMGGGRILNRERESCSNS